jgi:methenyltetrahydromethanopterin cyclohydrolase
MSVLIHADADYHHVPYMVTTHEDVYDAFKITNELTGKALCVYNKLNSSSSGFADAIKNLTQSFLLVI